MPKTPSTRSGKENMFVHIMRIAACFGVIVIHSASFNTLFEGEVPAYVWWLSNILGTLSVWSVPAFVMISGALLLNVEKKESLKTFYSKRLQRIVIPLLFWLTFYFIFFHFLRNDSLDIIYIFKRIVLQQPFDNLYFLFIIIELYFITPFLREIFATLSHRQRVYLIVLFLFIGIFWKYQRFVGTMFIPYIGYYLLGGFLLDKNMERYVKYAALIAVFSILVIAVMTYLFASHIVYNFQDDFFFFRHTNPFVMAFTISMFILVQQYVPQNLSSSTMQRLAFLSRLTFGIYLVHWPIRMFLLKVFFQKSDDLLPMPWELTLLMIPILSITSFAIALLFKQLPFLKRTI